MSFSPPNGGTSVQLWDVNFTVHLWVVNLMLQSAGRLSNKERKRTITEELLADPELSQARKKRFDKLQVLSQIIAYKFLLVVC